MKPQTKYCNKCEQNLSYSEFYKDKSSADGHQRYCKHCVKQYQTSFNDKFSKKNITRLLSDPSVSIEKLRLYFGVYVEEDFTTSD
jgi:transposase-like protein